MNKKIIVIAITFCVFILAYAINVTGASVSLNDGSFGMSVKASDPTGVPMHLGNGSFGMSVTAWEVEVPPPPIVSIPGSNGIFGMSVNVVETTIITEVVPDTWDAGNPNVGDSATENFTFYQNGTATINVLTGFNDTNYTYVNYATWDGNGHDQYTANFTIDAWSSETNIEPKVAGDPVTTIYSSLSGNSNFVFGIRIYMPKSVTFAGLKEDFKILFNSTKI